MDDKPIDNALDRDDLFALVLNADFFCEDLPEDFAVVHEDLLIEDCEEADALNSEKEIFSIGAVDGWADQSLTYRDNVLVVHICQTALLEQSTRHDQGPLEAQLLLKVHFFDHLHVLSYILAFSVETLHVQVLVVVVALQLINVCL